MAESRNWGFPPNLQPKSQDVDFDLESVLDSVVLLRAEIPEEAFTAPILGVERTGYGAVIRDDGLILTIGYLITEAASIWITTNRGVVVAGHPVAFDQETGFGLVQPLGRLGVPALERGSAATLEVGDDVIVIGQGGRAHALKARLVARREFAGYWEYMLEDALFTAPAHPQWGGTALVGTDGRLLGIGSLLVQERESLGGEAEQGNMFVPIDLLEPILDDLLKRGCRAGPPRPWLGLYTAEVQGQLMINEVAVGGPAARAGVRKGDVVLELAGERVSGIADLYRRLWHLGPAGVAVPLTLARKGEQEQLVVRSVDRNDLFAKPKLH